MSSDMPEGASLLTTTSHKRCFIVVGGTHGNESVGVRAITELQGLIQSGAWKIEGSVYGLVGNPQAYKRGLRFCDENLNRAFGRSENSDSYEARRAEEITRWFEDVAGRHSEVYLLDLHSVSTGDTRIAIFYARNEKAKAWAERISPIPLMLAENKEVVPGRLCGAIEKLGGTSVTIECGNHASETGLDVALEHVENALISLHMLRDHTPSFKGKVAYEGDRRMYTLVGVIKPRTGFAFDRPVSSETFLKQGEVYAHDNYGEHRAPTDCYILMPSKNPQPEDFDAGFLAVR